VVLELALYREIERPSSPAVPGVVRAAVPFGPTDVQVDDPFARAQTERCSCGELTATAIRYPLTRSPSIRSQTNAVPFGPSAIARVGSADCIAGAVSLPAAVYSAYCPASAAVATPTETDVTVKRRSKAQIQLTIRCLIQSECHSGTISFLARRLLVTSSHT